MPSSNALFREWYLRARGHYPDAFTVPTWAAIDVLESAVYRAATTPRGTRNGHVQADSVLAALKSSAVRTPFGRIAFDGNNVNYGIRTVLSQVLPSSNTSEIVYPSDLLTAAFVYPMPSWEDREYSWQLLAGKKKGVACGVSAVCSTAIAAVLTLAILRPHPHAGGRAVAGPSQLL